MSWSDEQPDPTDHPSWRRWTLKNDKGDELATIEHFFDGDVAAAPFYLWIMNPENPDEFVRRGPQSGDLAHVKARAEALLSGERQ